MVRCLQLARTSPQLLTALLCAGDVPLQRTCRSSSLATIMSTISPVLVVIGLPALCPSIETHMKACFLK